MKSDVAANEKRAQTLLISLDCGCNTLNMLICFLCANKPWCDQRSRETTEEVKKETGGKRNLARASTDRWKWPRGQSRTPSWLLYLSLSSWGNREGRHFLDDVISHGTCVQNKQNTVIQACLLLKGGNHLHRLDATVTSHNPFWITHRS